MSCSAWPGAGGDVVLHLRHHEVRGDADGEAVVHPVGDAGREAPLQVRGQRRPVVEVRRVVDAHAGDAEHADAGGEARRSPAGRRRSTGMGEAPRIGVDGGPVLRDDHARHDAGRAVAHRRLEVRRRRSSSRLPRSAMPAGFVSSEAASSVAPTPTPPIESCTGAEADHPHAVRGERRARRDRRHGGEEQRCPHLRHGPSPPVRAHRASRGAVCRQAASPWHVSTRTAIARCVPGWVGRRIQRSWLTGATPMFHLRRDATFQRETRRVRMASRTEVPMEPAPAPGSTRDVAFAAVNAAFGSLGRICMALDGELPRPPRLASGVETLLGAGRGGADRRRARRDGARPRAVRTGRPAPAGAPRRRAARGLARLPPAASAARACSPSPPRRLQHDPHGVCDPERRATSSCSAPPTTSRPTPPRPSPGSASSAARRR